LAVWDPESETAGKISAYAGLMENGQRLPKTQISDSNAPTQGETEQLCQLLKAYWVAQGFLGIKCWPELKADAAYGAKLWVVCSNIGPTGYPPRKAAGEAPVNASTRKSDE
jgi:hypothetical protein